MGKEPVAMKNRKLMDETNDLICLKQHSVLNNNRRKTLPIMSLASCINYVEKINPYANSNFGFLQIEENLRDEKLRTLIYELANAIDKNSIAEVKNLKSLYGTSKEFAQAKNFLNKKCKEIWNVHDNKKQKMKLPKEAMKALGISNQPTLDFLLGNSLKYFEKDNSQTTAKIIQSTLDNVNIDYTFDDICEYLKNAHHKKVFEYNFHTVKYLAQHTKFDKSKLTKLEISKQQIDPIFKTLSFKEKFYCIKNYYLKMLLKNINLS